MTLSVNTIADRVLTRPLACIVEPDGDAWIARVPDIPEVFGLGDDATDAVCALNRELSSL